MVQLKPLTVQKDLRQQIDISARVNINHSAYSSAREPVTVQQVSRQ